MKRSVVIVPVFGAHGQVAVGILFVIATAFQGVWWGIAYPPPDLAALFWLSIEALFFAAYGVIATGLGFRATERVEASVVAASETDASSSDEPG